MHDSLLPIPTCPNGPTWFSADESKGPLIAAFNSGDKRRQPMVLLCRMPTRQTSALNYWFALLQP